MRVDLLGETDRFLDRLRGLAGQADDKGAVDGDAEIPAVFGELAGPVDPDAFLDVDENLLVPGLVSQSKKTSCTDGNNSLTRAISPRTCSALLVR
jgi:hypothetical protein